MKLRSLSKKGAIELSMTTVVVIVLAMTMLILGLVLIRNIFTGATYNVQSINEKVRGEINKLFEEDNQAKSVVFLPELKTEVQQGREVGVAFSIRNLDPTTGTFAYAAKVSSTNCPQGVNPVNWLQPSTGTVTLASGESSNPYHIIRVRPPQTTPLCTARIDLEIRKDGQFYHQNYFDVEINPRGFFG